MSTSDAVHTHTVCGSSFAIRDDVAAAIGLTPEQQAPPCEPVTIGDHRYGVVMHDGKPHVVGAMQNGVPIPRVEDLPPGYGVIRDASAHLVLIADSGSG